MKKNLTTDLKAITPAKRKPSWLRIKRQGGTDYNEVKRLLRSADLHTVCESANCPNRGECFNSRTATFLMMGDVCTRHCTFCNIDGGRPRLLDCRVGAHPDGCASLWPSPARPIPPIGYDP